MISFRRLSHVLPLTDFCLPMSFDFEIRLFAVEHRKALHRRLGLPLDRPMLRVANALTLASLESSSNHSAGRSNYIFRLTLQQASKHDVYSLCFSRITI
jgi:hypothetical protein